MPDTHEEDSRSPLAHRLVLLPGRRDAWALLTVWYLRKASIPLFWLGLIVAMLIIGKADFSVSVGDSKSYWDELRSPLALAVVAIGLRVLSNLIALAASYPTARGFERQFDRRPGRFSAIGVWMDRLNFARALRALRLTHGARALAVEQLGETGRRVAFLDPALSTLNVLLPIALIVVALIVGD